MIIMIISCACGCGEEFEERDKWGRKRKFFQNHCFRLRKGKNHPMFGKRPANWKGGTVTKFGYTQIYSPTHPYRDSNNYVMRHRLVMEAHIGRYLLPEEVVHHIIPILKGGTDDIENLMLFSTHSEHVTYENTKDMSNRFCRVCNGKSYIDKKGHEHWYGNEKDGWLCTKCYNAMFC